MPNTLTAQPDTEAGAEFRQLLSTLARYSPDADFDLLRRAFAFASEKHAAQTRVSGEPYITHPVAVAQILAGLEMDLPTLAAALLHDVVEDTSVTTEELAERFSPEIAGLVDGVTKLALVHTDLFGAHSPPVSAEPDTPQEAV